MKKSRAVQAFLIVSVATSCGPRHCVDETGKPADDRNCSTGGTTSGSTTSGGHTYVWASGRATTDAAAESGTTRGVVGAEGAAHAGEGSGAHGGGGEGGHGGGGGGE